MNQGLRPRRREGDYDALHSNEEPLPPDRPRRKPPGKEKASLRKVRKAERSQADRIARWLEYLVKPGQTVALWVKDARDDSPARSPNRTGYFTDLRALAKAAVARSEKATGISDLLT